MIKAVAIAESMPDVAIRCGPDCVALCTSDLLSSCSVLASVLSLPTNEFFSPRMDEEPDWPDRLPLHDISRLGQPLALIDLLALLHGRVSLQLRERLLLEPVRRSAARCVATRYY